MPRQVGDRRGGGDMMEEEEEEEAVFIRDVTDEDPSNAHQAQHRPVQATGPQPPEEEVVVFARENRRGSAQHATRETPTRSSHRSMRA